MEFIVNNKKYAILNHELYINYLMVNEYFRTYAKYDYDIHFDFLDSILSMDRIDFDDIVSMHMCHILRAGWNRKENVRIYRPDTVGKT